MLTAVLSVLPVLAMGAGNKKEKTLQERLEGTWVRPNHRFSLVIKDNQWIHFDEKVPFKPTDSGEIQFPQGRDYAVVKTKSGFTWWLFSAGENVIATEHFEPSGALHDTSDGRVFYRKGTVMP
jgi:hypothetical protein